jgi:glucose-specific phosphotransferase system IIA component
MSFTNGTIMPMEEVHDEIFSKEMMGSGIAIVSTDGKYYSPVDGTISMVFPTKHALGIISVDRQELLLHIGIDTVMLKGEGFTSYVNQGDRVAKGDLLLEVDISFLKEKGIYSEAILCLVEPKGVNLSFTSKHDVIAKEDILATFNL